MPPKRRVSEKKIPILPSTTQNDEESLEAELKFDKEVYWTINQFEKLIESGKINEAKKNESLKAIATLKRSTTPKIQKIQLMKQYFKDYKSKMKAEEENISQHSTLTFDNDQQNIKGVYVKKKSGVAGEPSKSSFLFNFNDQVSEITENIDSVKL